MAILPAPFKTQLGVDELRGRSRTLSQRHRTVLLLVDGRRALGEVLSMAQQAGAQASHFEDLLRMGMVEAPEFGASQAETTAPGRFSDSAVTSFDSDDASSAAPAVAPQAPRMAPVAVRSHAQPAPQAAGPR
ncbi:MAG: hypothetical protein WA210_13790, partial [Burkholderiaceae bacterium]